MENDVRCQVEALHNFSVCLARHTLRQEKIDIILHHTFTMLDLTTIALMRLISSRRKEGPRLREAKHLDQSLLTAC
jgi:hypothetical protein